MDAFYEFSRQTGFQGFAFAQDAHHVAEKVTWYTLIIVALVLTMYDTVNNVCQFMDEPTTMAVEIMDSRQLPFRNLQLCAAIDTDATRIYPPKSVGVYEPLISKLNVFNDTVVTEVLQHFDQYTNTYDYFSGKDAQAAYSLDADIEDNGYFRALLSLTVKMLGRIAYMESDDRWIRAQYIRPCPDVRWSYVHDRYSNRTAQFLTPNNTIKITPTLEKIYNWYRSKNIDFEQLIRMVGASICQFLMPEVGFEQFDDGKYASMPTMAKYDRGICEPQRVTYFGKPHRLLHENMRDVVCWRSDLDDLKSAAFYENKIAIRIRIPGTRFLFNNQSNFASWKWKGYLLLSDDPILDVEAEHVIALVGQPSTLEMNLENVYYAANLRRKPCLQTETYVACQLKCRAQEFVKYCGCWPLGVFHVARKPTEVDYCIADSRYPHPNEYIMPQIASAECLKFLDGVVNSSCRLDCSKQCERKTYRFNQEVESSTVRSNDINVEIIFTRFTYASYVERLTMDSTQFISNLGGTLGVWIGASFMTIIHVIFYCTRRLVMPTHLVRVERKVNGVSPVEANLQAPSGV